MNRRQFIGLSATLLLPVSARGAEEKATRQLGASGFEADIIIAGGGLGGCAAALAALRSGLRVILTEETDWLGGQLTSQAVPPDEHPWIETHGCTRSYRALRNGIRSYYKQH